MDRYEELYRLAKEVHAEEVRRFDLASQKAAWFLSALSVLLGLAAVLAKWLLAALLPPRDLMSWILFVFGVLLFVFIAIAWAASFRVLRGVKLSKMPLNDEMISFFLNNREVDIQHALARNYEEGHRHNRKRVDAQSRLLGQAHTFMVLAFVAFLLFSIIGVAYVWSHPLTPNTMRSAMAEESKSSETGDAGQIPSEKPVSAPTTEPAGAPPPADTTPSGPDPKVVAPKMELITHGADESRVTRAILGPGDKAEPDSTAKGDAKGEK
jgi:hypothetical protein